MGTWQNIGDTAKLATFLAPKFGNLMIIWRLLEITGEIYNIIICDAFSFGLLDCKNSPQSHIVRVYDAGHGKSGVFHSAEWHVGDWSSDGIREAWLRFFIWVVSVWLG
ncbi:hypothetical protein TNCV_2724851 [Trichonephila clavipes]|nr:hypothetical protein TNCV_2724851 [Trichonephila clavipes]